MKLSPLWQKFYLAGQYVLLALGFGLVAAVIAIAVIFGGQSMRLAVALAVITSLFSWIGFMAWAPLDTDPRISASYGVIYSWHTGPFCYFRRCCAAVIACTYC